MPAFDWYQATIRAPLDDVLSCLDGLADGLRLTHARGRHGYAHSARLGNDEHGIVGEVLHGGSHAYPHVQVTSDWAPPGVELIRAAFPEHAVARVDVKEDFADREAYETIQAVCVDQARAHRVRVGTAGDHLLTKEGRTCYLGSTKSAVRMRLYDKAAEMLASVQAPPGVDARQAFGIPEYLTRLEAQIRPATKEAKQAFATIEPMQALGSAAWMRDVWKGVLGLDLAPVQVRRGYRQSDDERAWNFMLSQYGPLLRRVRSDLGSWACVGQQIGDDLAK